MISEMLMYSYCLTGGALMLLVLLGLAVSVCMPGMDKWSRRFFIASFSVLMPSIGAYLIDLFICSDPSLAQTERVVAFIETLLPTFLMPLLSIYILHCCDENWRDSTLFRAELALWLIFFILLCITQITEGIYYITPDNQFVRGFWYPILIVPMIALVVVNLAGVIRRRYTLTKKYFTAFLVYLLPLLIAMTVQMFTIAFLQIVIAVSVSAFSMLWIVLTDQIEKNLRQQRVISDQYSRIAVLQMRPHFIYNTMMSIYYLCEQNPKLAQFPVMGVERQSRSLFRTEMRKDDRPLIQSFVMQTLILMQNAKKRAVIPPSDSPGYNPYFISIQTVNGI